MSWLIDSAASREDLLALHPALAADHDRVLAAVWAGSVRPQILELCRLRTATLLGNAVAWNEPRSPAAVAAGLDETMVDELSTWATNPAFDAAARACIGLAEQYRNAGDGDPEQLLTSALSAFRQSDEFRDLVRARALLAA